MTAVPSPESTVHVRAVDQLAPRLVSWLWPGRLALGKLAILDGDPGLGKSLVALDLCARLSTGRPFPDDGPGPGPANALVLNGEDGAADTIRPRLQALGADLSRVFVLEVDDDTGAALLRLPTQTDLLEAAMARTQARLVVIDPLMEFLDPSICTGSDQSVRRALAPLARLAAKYQCVILLVRHLNKRGGPHASYRGGGSIGFLAACRSGWLIAPEPHVPHRRVLAQVKNNLAPPQPSLAYEIVAQEGAPPSLSWLGVSPLTADQLLEGAATAEYGGPRDRAKEFLTDFLEDGARTVREIWATAEEQGVSWRTLRRAKQDLQIRSQRVRVDDQLLHYWLLRGQELPPTVPPEAVPPSLEEWLAPLREKYPPSTPLDDD